MLFCFLLIFNNIQAQITSDRIDSIINSAFEILDHTAGFAIAVVKDGEIVHAKGYGVNSIETNVPVNENTLFGIASNSKAFTTAALAILVDQGKIKWEDKVIDHIHEFKMYDSYVTNNFNIQDLITHRSGLGLGAGDLMLFPEGGDFTIDDILASFQHFEPTSAFRTKFDYDNLLYLVAGELISRVSGLTWEMFIEEQILKPLQMDNSMASIENVNSKINVAKAHAVVDNTLVVLKSPSNDDEKKPEQKLNGAAGGIWASASDMCEWMLVQLHGGQYGPNLDKRLFTMAQKHEMWRMHTPMYQHQDPRSPFKVHFSGYGLGWFLSDFNGYLKVEHSGLIPGMSSQVTLIPELDLGIVVLNNSTGANFLDGLVNFILLDEYLKIETGINWLEMAKGMQQQQQEMGDPESRKVWKEIKENGIIDVNHEDYKGVFEDDWFGRVEIYEKDNELWFKSYKSPRLKGKMSFYKGNSFAIKWEYQDMNADAFAIFSLDVSGKAQGIKMKGISHFIDFSFDFQDLNLKRVL